MFLPKSRSVTRTSQKGESSSLPAIHCKEVRDAWIGPPQAPSGVSYLSLGGSTIFESYCDQSTDGGGWTIVSSYTGADGESPLTSNVVRSGNPMTFGHYNTARQFKSLLSTVSSESLYLRSSGVWLRTNVPMFSSNLATDGLTEIQSTAIATTSGGTVADVMQGWTTKPITKGGDFGVVLRSGSCSICHFDEVSPFSIF